MLIQWGGEEKEERKFGFLWGRRMNVIIFYPFELFEILKTDNQNKLRPPFFKI